jgi:hypothetical protein
LSNVLARAVQERATERRLQRFALVTAGTAAYPTRWKDRFWKDKQAPGGESYFVRQEQTAGASPSFLLADLSPNLVNSIDPDVLVSDNGDLAIESTAAEPKVFFATKARVKEGNAALKGRLRLRQTDRYLKVTQGTTTKKLFETEPIVPSAGQQGLAVKTPQRCNEMAEFVTGKFGVEATATKQSHRIMAETLTAVTGEDFTSRLRAGFRTHQELADYGVFLDDLVERFQEAMADPVESPLLEAELTRRLLNEALAPDLGAAISTLGLTTGDQERQNKLAGLDLFSYHFAAVVAKSGTDYVTVENYARRDPRSQGTLSGNDPLYFVRMYGVGAPPDSFHARQLATGAFAGTVVTLQVE